MKIKTYARIEKDTVVELFETDGEISEMFHPDMVWVDVSEVPDIVERWKKVGAGFFPPAPPTLAQEEIIAQYEKALDAHLDSVAKIYRYDSRFTFALRAGYSGPYQAEAIAFAQWMDDCNVHAFARMSRVLEGAEPMPTIEALIADLPVFILPA